MYRPVRLRELSQAFELSPHALASPNGDLALDAGRDLSTSTAVCTDDTLCVGKVRPLRQTVADSAGLFQLHVEGLGDAEPLR